jgi:hypothetical protein
MSSEFMFDQPSVTITTTNGDAPALTPPPENGDVMLPNGCNLYWKYDPATGGREYFSDEIGGGVMVWHTALVDPYTLMAAMVKEQEFQVLERHIAERLNKQ